MSGTVNSFSPLCVRHSSVFHLDFTFFHHRAQNHLWRIQQRRLLFLQNDIGDSRDLGSHRNLIDQTRHAGELLATSAGRTCLCNVLHKQQDSLNKHLYCGYNSICLSSFSTVYLVWKIKLYTVGSHVSAVNSSTHTVSSLSSAIAGFCALTLSLLLSYNTRLLGFES